MNLKKIKEIRVQKKITQEEMAKKLGYKHKSAYNMIENGKREMKADTALKIAKILDVSLDDIFFDNDVVKVTTKKEMTA